MEQSLDKYSRMPVSKAVIQNALPAVAAMLMVLIYNLADTFFIGQTHDAYQVAAVSLATPVFLVFMSIGTIFGIGGTSVIYRAFGEGRNHDAFPLTCVRFKVCSASASYPFAVAQISLMITTLSISYSAKFLIRQPPPPITYSFIKSE